MNVFMSGERKEKNLKMDLGLFIMNIFIQIFEMQLKELIIIYIIYIIPERKDSEIDILMTQSFQYHAHILPGVQLNNPGELVYAGPVNPD